MRICSQPPRSRCIENKRASQPFRQRGGQLGGSNCANTAALACRRVEPSSGRDPFVSWITPLCAPGRSQLRTFRRREAAAAGGHHGPGACLCRTEVRLSASLQPAASKQAPLRGLAGGSFHTWAPPLRLGAMRFQQRLTSEPQLHVQLATSIAEHALTQLVRGAGRVRLKMAYGAAMGQQVHLADFASVRRWNRCRAL